MTGSNTAVLGVTTSGIGAMVLPNTHGNKILLSLSIVTLCFGVLIVASFVGSRLATKLFAK